MHVRGKKLRNFCLGGAGDMVRCSGPRIAPSPACQPTLAHQPLAPHHPLIEREREAAGEVTHALGRLREGRDAASEQAFRLMFQNPVLFAGVLGMVGKEGGNGNSVRPNAD